MCLLFLIFTGIFIKMFAPVLINNFDKTTLDFSKHQLSRNLVLSIKWKKRKHIYGKSMDELASAQLPFLNFPVG